MFYRATGAHDEHPDVRKVSKYERGNAGTAASVGAYGHSKTGFYLICCSAPTRHNRKALLGTTVHRLLEVKFWLEA